MTITEAIDPNAGVAFSARHCFMLETISINLKPRVQMTGPGYEISLRDDLWQQLLIKGKICGDERWLIGENSQQEIVIVHFDRRRKGVVALELGLKVWRANTTQTTAAKSSIHYRKSIGTQQPQFHSCS